MATASGEIWRPLRVLRSLLSPNRNLPASDAPATQNSTLHVRLRDCFSRTWDLGFTAFGGPPVHFQIIYARFVEGKDGEKWIDEQTYQELFAVCQALPGPASTKMLFATALLHAGFIPALMVFALWSLPAALAMYGLSLGVQRIGDVLPNPVYALLSGLNASTVGFIALAATQLGEKSIKDNVTRILVIFGACAGLCYSALWYFPVLITIGGLTTLSWDIILRPWAVRYRNNRRRRSSPEGFTEATASIEGTTVSRTSSAASTIQRRLNVAATRPSNDSTSDTSPQPQDGQSTEALTGYSSHTNKVRTGVFIFIGFFVTFLVTILTRALLTNPPTSFILFSNLYLAGTIIFGGGPVVIPLLRSYVVDPGWVTPRDFLIGLAVIQAMPGPNFNFAVYLGALAMRTISPSTPSFFGAVIGYAGVFAPGLCFALGVQGVWRVLRTKTYITSILRGVNSTAVGLVFTAVYRLWEIGYLRPAENGVERGSSLASEPWWVVVAVLAYAAAASFKVPPAVVVVCGAALGVAWWGVVGRNREV